MNVSYSSVCKYIARKKSEKTTKTTKTTKTKEAYLRIHREPGLECEFDWGEVKDKSDITELIDLLKEKLYQSTKNTDTSRKNKKKPEDLGVKQLVNQMKLIYIDDFEFDKNIPDEVAYYPVLVLEDTHLVIPGISSIINSWYKDLIDKELPDQMCHPIVVMSINTLIRYHNIFSRFGFHKVFDNYYRKAVIYDKDGIHWSFSPFADFDVFIKEHYNISDLENQKMFKEILATFGLNDVKPHIS